MLGVNIEKEQTQKNEQQIRQELLQIAEELQYVEDVRKWYKKEGYDHMIICVSGEGDDEVIMDCYPARPNDKLPPDEKWRHLSFEKWERNVHPLSVSYKEMNVREIAKIEAVKAMGPTIETNRPFANFEIRSEIEIAEVSAQIADVRKWYEKDRFDHMIVHILGEGDDEIIVGCYPARPNDMLPPDMARDEKWKHLSFEEWEKNMHPLFVEPYEEMYAREIAEVEAVKFMRIGNESVPVELSSRISYQFKNDEQGKPRFIDNKEYPSLAMATAEIDDETFMVCVSEEGIERRSLALFIEYNHESHQEINLKLQGLAQDRLIEVLNGCVPIKAKEYGEAHGLDKEYIDTLAKNTIVRRSLDNQNQIFVDIKIPEPTLEKQNKPEQEHEEDVPEKAIEKEQTPKREEPRRSQSQSRGR